MGAAVVGRRATTQMVGATPVALFLREHGALWAALKAGDTGRSAPPARQRSATTAQRVLEMLRARGALFTHELVAASGLDDGRVRDGARRRSSPPA